MREHTIAGIIGAIGGVVAAALGGWDYALRALFMVMVVDYVTGWIVAAVFNKSKKTASGAIESNAAFKGLVKKGVMLLIVLVGVSLDNLIQVSFVRSMIIISIIVIELTSITENLELMGIPIHKVTVLRKVIGILKERGEVETEEK